MIGDATTAIQAGLGDSEVIIRAQWVKRFHLLPMSISQSIAEHQWNVAMLFMAVWPAMLRPDDCRTGLNPLISQSLGIQWAMTHDLPEVYTGDFPTHIKSMSPAIKGALHDVEAAVMPGRWNEIRELIDRPENALVRGTVKACDLADTIRSCRYIQNPAMVDFVRLPLIERFKVATLGFPPEVRDYLVEYYNNG